MNHSVSKLTCVLTTLGAVPFVVCALGSVFGYSQIAFGGTVIHNMSVYTLVIGAFMAGTSWGHHLHVPRAHSTWLTIMSNSNALALCSGFIALTPRHFLLVAIAVFALVLLCDLLLFTRAWLSSSYIVLRATITAVVMSSLIVMWFTL